MIPVINEHGAQPFAATKVKDCFFYIHPNRLNRMCPALPHSTGEQLANILNDFKSCESLYLEMKACECFFFFNILTLLTCNCSSLWNRSGEDVIPCSSIDLWVSLLLSGCPRCRAFTAALRVQSPSRITFSMGTRQRNSESERKNKSSGAINCNWRVFSERRMMDVGYGVCLSNDV